MNSASIAELRTENQGLALALSEVAHIALHGDREQQVLAAYTAKEYLLARGYPVRSPAMRTFVVSIKDGFGLQSWDVLSRSSVDALLSVLDMQERPIGKITVRPGEARK